MSDLKCTRIPYKVYRGIKVPASAKEEFFDTAILYQPQNDDVFIITYPKCGTTWVQHILFLIYNAGNPARNAADVVSTIPFPEQDGFPKAKKHLAIKYHLPFHATPFSKNSKYIYVVRNPLDTCVSYYHFLKNLPGYHIGTIDEFFECFANGELPYGDFFDHMLSWSEIWNEDNVLFLTYEFMKENHRDAVRKIAVFLGMTKIADDDIILNDIVLYSKSDYMKRLVDDTNFMKEYLSITSCSGNRDVFNSLSRRPSSESFSDEEATKPRMIRKGCVGDWKNHLSQKQAKKMKEIFLNKTKGTKAKNLWADIFKEI